MTESEWLSAVEPSKMWDYLSSRGFFCDRRYSSYSVSEVLNNIWVNLGDEAANLFREVFGNPFQPVTIEANWLTWQDCTVPLIVRGIYEERAFHRMPILHDALLDAGCDNEAILQHCMGMEPIISINWISVSPGQLGQSNWIVHSRFEVFKGFDRKKDAMEWAEKNCGVLRWSRPAYDNSCTAVDIIHSTVRTWRKSPIAHVRGCWVLDLIHRNIRSPIHKDFEAAWL